MGQYRFDLIDMRGGISRSQFHNCADDLEALDKAETLCDTNAVDVWDGSRRVLHLKLENALATPRRWTAGLARPYKQGTHTKTKKPPPLKGGFRADLWA